MLAFIFSEFVEQTASRQRVIRRKFDFVSALAKYPCPVRLSERARAVCLILHSKFIISI